MGARQRGTVAGRRRGVGRRRSAAGRDAALVATKLHAFCDRQRDEKRTSDALDIYRLLETQDRDGEVAIATNGGPRGLAEVVREVIVERFVDGATRIVRYLKAYGDPAWPEITADDL